MAKHPGSGSVRRSVARGRQIGAQDGREVDLDEALTAGAQQVLACAALFGAV
jgi:hypothetical protein